MTLERTDSIHDDLSADLAPPGARRRWLRFTAFALLAFVVAIVIANADTRGLIGDAWREMLEISPWYLALIVLFKVGQAILSAMTWRNILAAAYPGDPLPLRLVVGLDQGQDAVNLVSPARAGTWAMLGVFALNIPGARAPTLMAVWGVQNLAYLVFAVVNYVLLAFFVPGAAEGWDDIAHRIRTFGSDRPWLSTLIAILVGIAAIALVTRVRSRVTDLKAQVLLGASILGTPRRYLRLVFLPSFFSLCCRASAYAALLAAFEIPVTFWTVALATGSHALAGAMRVTPGGVGTTQAIDVIALREYAPAATVTAYSLSEAAITALMSFGISLIALIAALGFGGTISLIRHQPQANHRNGSPTSLDLH